MCGQPGCYSAASSNNKAIWYACDTFNLSLQISSEIDNVGFMQYIRYDNLIFEHCISHPVDHEHAWFYYVDENPAAKPKEGCVNLSRIPYPETFSEKINRVLMNLYRRNNQYGAEISGDTKLARAFFDETFYPEQGLLGMAKMMIDLGLLVSNRTDYVSITAKGWQRIDELIRNQANSRKCFIAMAYGGKTKAIREAIRAGVNNAGYKELLMDEKEHNNQIVPEMLRDIVDSQFIIMDVSYPNYGAYFEAGFAQGKGKDIIITCSEKNKRRNRPHFDIQQQPIIYWKDENDLTERLEKKIRATIGIPFELASKGFDSLH